MTDINHNTRTGDDVPVKKKSRFETLRDEFGSTIHAYLTKEQGGSEEEIAASFAVFANYDPTKNRPHKPYAYLQWMCNAFQEMIDQGEDISRQALEKIAHNLELFTEFKQRYPQAGFEKDINKHNLQSLQTLANFIEGGHYESNNSKEKAERASIMGETTLHYAGDEGMILTPLTKRASQFWGRKTKWCTAENSGSNFNTYNQKGPLVIYIPKNLELSRSKKFQGNRGGGLVNDEDSRIESVPENLQSLIDAAVMKVDGMAEFLFKEGSVTIRHISPGARTLDACKAALDDPSNHTGSDGNILQYMPDFVWEDEQFAEKAMRQNPSMAYKAIPESMRNLKFSFMAVSLASSSRRDILSAVPQKVWEDSAFCSFVITETEESEIAIAKAGDNAWQNEEFCKRAVTVSSAKESVLGKIHSSVWLKKDFCLAAMNQMEKDRALDYILSSATGMEVPPAPERPITPRRREFGHEYH